MTFSDTSFFFLLSLPKLIPLVFLVSYFSVYFWAATYSSAYFITSLTFPLYSSCFADGFWGCCFTGFSSGGGISSYSYLICFLAGGWAGWTWGWSEGFLANLAAEGGLYGFLISFFSSFFSGSFFSGSGSAFPKTLLTKGSDAFPEVAHLWSSCKKRFVN